MTSSPRRPRTSRTRTVVPARPAVGRARLATVAASMVVVTTAFGWRLADLQLTPDPALAGEVGSQVRGVTISAPRGQIVDRYGREIALSLPRPSVVVDPRLVPEPEVASIVAQLAPLLSTDPAVLEERLRKDSAFAYLERQVEQEVGEAVMSLELPGVSLDEEPYREHPIDECSGLAVAGRVDIDQNGISGLEEAYDEHLTGSPGYMIRQTQLGGDVRIPGGSRLIDPVEPGEDLRLTLDRNIQYRAERLLADALTDSGGDLGIAIVSIPTTGEILAMANVVRGSEVSEPRCTTTNLGATWAYEPGSIMKPLTFAGVFEEGAWSVDRSVEVPMVISIHRGAGLDNHEWIEKYMQSDEIHTPAWIMAKSSNNGTITLASELGATGLYETFRAFGLGERTGLDFKGEASGILDELDSHALELSNAAIGQGVAVTPLQMIQAYNTLAAGGMRVPLVLVADEAGATESTYVVSPETARTVLGLMRGVVSEGTGTRAAVPGYVVAGKTGTAWQPCSSFGYECEGGGYHYTASFAGIVENDLGPALSVLVVIDDPVGETGGGKVAAPVFADLAAYALGQLDVAPTSSAARPEGRVRAQPAMARPIASSAGEVDQ